jgi:hypothetical protein
LSPKRFKEKRKSKVIFEIIGENIKIYLSQSQVGYPIAFPKKKREKRGAKSVLFY